MKGTSLRENSSGQFIVASLSKRGTNVFTHGRLSALLARRFRVTPGFKSSFSSGYTQMSIFPISEFVIVLSVNLGR